MKKRFLVGLLVVALLLAVVIPSSLVLAADPTVSITIRVEFVSMSNTQSEFAVGIVEAGGDAVKWGDSDTYSEAENTGSIAIDIELQGMDMEGGAYDWTLAASAGDKNYMLKANSNHDSTYDIEIQNAGYTNLTTNLAAQAKWTWSMEFTPPTIFDASDDGESKAATLTLVASEYTP